MSAQKRPVGASAARTKGPAVVLTRKHSNPEVAADTSENRLLRAFRFMPDEAKRLMLMVAESYDTEPA
jgi:hypothetical protein